MPDLTFGKWLLESIPFSIQNSWSRTPLRISCQWFSLHFQSLAILQKFFSACCNQVFINIHNWKPPPWSCISRQFYLSNCQTSFSSHEALLSIQTYSLAHCPRPSQFQAFFLCSKGIGASKTRISCHPSDSWPENLNGHSLRIERYRDICPESF